MKRTIAWPPRLVNGGLAMTADPDDADADDDARGEALRQVIRLRLLDGASANAFQVADKLGIDDLTFRAGRAADNARTVAEVRRHFRALERARRAKLVSVSASTRGSARTVSIEYEDLETGGRTSMEIAR